MTNRMPAWPIEKADGDMTACACLAVALGVNNPARQAQYIDRYLAILLGEWQVVVMDRIRI